MVRSIRILFTELFYVVDGKGEFNIQEPGVPVKANDFVIINPQVEHTDYLLG